MWEQHLPDESDHLRQGDLLAEQPMPSRGKVELTASGLVGHVKPSTFTVVLERCCTVENKMTVMLAKVGRVADMGPDHRMTRALFSETPVPGEPYAWYEHLLQPLPGRLDARPNSFWVIQLLERFSVASRSHDELAELRTRRVARMTPLARARLRAKLVAHWGRAEDDDAVWLSENGYDAMGRPMP